MTALKVKLSTRMSEALEYFGHYDRSEIYRWRPSTNTRVALIERKLIPAGYAEPTLTEYGQQILTTLARQDEIAVGDRVRVLCEDDDRYGFVREMNKLPEGMTVTIDWPNLKSTTSMYLKHVFKLDDLMPSSFTGACRHWPSAGAPAVGCVWCRLADGASVTEPEDGPTMDQEIQHATDQGVTEMIAESIRVLAREIETELSRRDVLSEVNVARLEKQYSHGFQLAKLVLASQISPSAITRRGLMSMDNLASALGLARWVPLAASEAAPER